MYIYKKIYIFLMLFSTGTVNSIETYLCTDSKEDDGGAHLHYGTWESAVYGLAYANELRSLRSQLFPERLPSFKPKVKMSMMPHRSPVVDNKWVLPFLGSDKSVVSRSQRFFYENDKKRPVQVATYFSVPSFLAVLVLAFFGTVFAILTKFSLGRKLLLKVFVLFCVNVRV